MATQLSDTTIRAAKPRDDKYILNDVRGLHLEIMPSGRKIWRMRYTLNGNRSWYTIGEYPTVKVADARARLAEVRRRVKDGLPPEERPEQDVIFGALAERWAKEHDVNLSNEVSKKAVRSILRMHILPHLGRKDIRKITPPEVLSVLKKLAAVDKYGALRHTKLIISQVFKFAAAEGIVMYDPCSVLNGAISRPPVEHFASFRNPSDIKRLLEKMDTYQAKQTRLAALYLLYSMCRIGEQRFAEWSEIDWQRKEWRIPPEKMKKRRAHIVPLSDQLISILEAMRPISGHGRYIFPHANTPDGSKPMSQATIRKMLRRLGFTNDDITPHGFRSMASTVLNENGFNSDWIERQLAHVEGNKVRAAYNYADFLEDRRRMLQWYADYLDGLRGGAMDLE